MVLAEVVPEPYRPSELEAVARLILQDQRVRVVAGARWSYYPERAEVSYPANLLDQWPAPRSLGALCHEIGEVLFSGSAAIAVFQEFAEWASVQSCERASADLLLNAINDLRVNHSYLERFPGSRRYFSALYRDAALIPKDDLRHRPPGTGLLPHHAYIDALTARWAVEALGVDGEGYPQAEDRIRRAVARTWPALRRAETATSLAELAELVRAEVFPIYLDLLEASYEEIRRAERQRQAEAEPPPMEVDESAEDEGFDGDLPPEDLRALVRGSPADDGPPVALVLLPEDG